jgi:hypothetical protein
MYNQEYGKIAHGRDPALLGAPLSEWAEMWDFFQPHLNAAYYDSQTTRGLGRTFFR